MLFKVGTWKVRDVVEMAENMQWDDQAVIGNMAFTLLLEKEVGGKDADWPNRLPYLERRNKENFPEEIWEEAQAQFETLSPEEQQAKRDLLRDLSEGLIAKSKEVHFGRIFDYKDIFWFGLAGAWAFWTGLKGSGKE